MWSPNWFPGWCVIRRLFFLFMMALLAQAAAAQTACRVGSGAFPFGTYDTVTVAPTDSAFNILVNCTRNGGPQSVTLNLAAGPGQYSSTPSGRRMSHTGGSGSFLAYGLFTDGSRLTPLGSTQGVDTLSQTLSIANKDIVAVTFTVYGRIPAEQNVYAGSYADSVQVTITP
jgi:spore coat protein U-like protein